MNRKILQIALPSIVSNITVPLLGLVDVAIVGHMGAQVYIGAIAVGGMMFNLLYWIFAFLRMGTSGLTSQAYGRGDMREVDVQLQRSLAVSLLLSLIVLVLQWPLRESAIYLVGSSQEVARAARLYFSIGIWGAPAVLCQYSLMGWFIGMQNTRFPMVSSIVQNIANIVVSTLLVFGLGMKVEGVALGTVLAQYVGVASSLLMWYHSYGRECKAVPMAELFDVEPMLRFFRINRDIFLRTLCIITVTLYFTSVGAHESDLLLAANTLLMQFFIVFSYVMDGYANAAEALCGHAYGARDHSAFIGYVRRIFCHGGGMVLLFSIVYALFRLPIIDMLTDVEAVRSVAHGLSLWTVLIPVSSIVAFVLDGVYIGITGTRQMLLSLFISAITFFVVLLITRGLMPTGHALWLSFCCYLFMRGLVLFVAFLRGHFFL